MSMGVIRRTLAVLALAGLAACGTGSGTDLPPFEIAAIGPGGGTVAAGDVTVNFPAGAFTQQTQVSILPELNPLPFVVNPGDPCMYAYLGPLWCVGPVGHNVFVPSVLTVRYDESLIPPGRTENDLVLFAWDDAAQVMRLVPGAVQDQAANQFTFNTYIELGHLAVMVRNCPQRAAPAFAFVAAPRAGVPLDTDGGGPSPGLYIADADADLSMFPPIQLPTNAAIPTAIAPSRDGTQILYAHFPLQRGGLELNTVTVAGGSPVQLAVGQNPSFDFYGWWGNTGGSTDAFYLYGLVDQTKPGAGSGALVDTTRDEQVIAVEAADGSDLGDFHGIPEAFFSLFRDMRQAPDDGHIAIHYRNFPEGSQDFVETVNAATGALVGTELPLGDGLFMPRFNAAGNKLVRVSSNQEQAIESNLDGTGDLVIYDVMSTITGEFTLLDFAPAPDGVHFLAYVRDNFAQGASIDRLVVGTIDGSGQFTVLESESLDDELFVDEIVWHPDSRHVYIDGFAISSGTNGVIPVSIDPAADAPDVITVNPAIPVFRIGQVDVNTTDGRLLVTIGSGLSDSLLVLPPRSTHFTSPGVWVSNPDGSSPLLVIDDLDGQPIREWARWLRSWRNTPGTFSGVR